MEGFQTLYVWEHRLLKADSENINQSLGLQFHWGIFLGSL